MGPLRHQITCHSPPFPICQNSATTVARTSLTKTACLSIYWWSMEPAVSKKYCRTDICLSCRHTERSALSSATLSSRHYVHMLATGPAGAKGRFVREIILSLDGISAQERERVHPCNICDKAFKSMQLLSQHKVWQHSGNVFVCKG